jgi:ABC-type branched-subunit amino acid transport system permease subunit
MLGSAFAAASGVLTAIVVGTLDPTILTLLLVQAFGAAAIGYFSNLGLSFVGGLFLGVLSALTTYWVQGNTALSGLPNAIPFLALLIMLLLTPRGRLVVQRAAHFTPTAVKAAGSRRWLIAKTLAGVAIVLLAPQVLGDSRLPSLTEALVLTILFLSLGVLVHLSGQVSLIQYSLAAVGAVAFSDLTGVHGMPWLLALLLAGLITTPVGAIVAIPAIRVSGLFLAVATFGFGLVLQQLFYPLPLMFGDRFGIPTPRPSWAQGQLAYYYVVAGVVALAALLVIFVTRSRLGRLLRGLAGSPVAVETNGASLEVTKVLIFCLSAFLAGIAGALVGPITGSVTSTPFDPLNSLILLTVLILAGGGMVRYAFIGGIALALIPSYITNPLINSYLQILFGVSAVVIAIMAARTAHQRSPLATLTRAIGPARRLVPGAAPGVPASPPAGAAATEVAAPVDHEEVTS